MGLCPVGAFWEAPGRGKKIPNVLTRVAPTPGGSFVVPVLDIFSAQRNFVATRGHLSSVSILVVRIVSVDLFSGQAILVFFGGSLQASTREKKGGERKARKKRYANF